MRVHTIKTNMLSAGTWLILLVSFSASLALAGPGGAHVVAGRGHISKPDAVTTEVEQQSKRLVLDWSSFNVAPGERVKFEQPSASAAVLNRIFDQQPSRIRGAIQANGRVYLLNPNGILFGPSAHVDVGSLFATSLNIKPRDFMAQRLNFAAAPGQDGGPIINQGLINASGGGSVNLFGSRVSNRGVIVAKLGQVNLAAGRAVTVDFNGDGLIRLALSGAVRHNRSGAKAAVSNTGKIAADGGRVLMSGAAAKTIFHDAVNNSGVVAARGIERHGGEIRLVGAGGDTVNNGRLDVSGRAAHANGGVVRLLGDNVSQAGRINANAGESGAGGSVRVRARDTAHLAGRILARGGSVAGPGGDAEVSGAKHLSVSTSADLSAPHGADGTLLLDPGMISICHLGDSCATPRGGLDVLSDAYVNTELKSQDVLIATASGAQGPETIKFLDPTINIDSTSGHSLSLAAGKSIMLQGRVIVAGHDAGANAAFNLSAKNIVNIGALTLGGDVSATTPLDLSMFPVHLDSAVRLDTSAANAPVRLDRVEGPGRLTIASGKGDVSLGTLGEVQALAGFADMSSATTTLHGDITSGGAHPGGMTFAGAVRLANERIHLQSGGGDIKFNAAVEGPHALRVDAGLGAVNVAGAIGGETPLSALKLSAASIELGDSVTTSGAQAYTGSTRLGGDLTGASLSFNAALKVPVRAALTADTIAFNGKRGSVTGAASLSIQPLSAGTSVTLGKGAGLSLATAPLTNYAGELSIGGLRSSFSDITPRAGPVVVDSGLDLGSGGLTLVGENGIVLKRGALRAAALTLLAAGPSAAILARRGGGSSLIADRITLVAGGNIGAGLGREIKARALHSTGRLQIASGGDQQAFIINSNDSLHISTGFAAREATQLAQALGLPVNTDETVTNAGQVTALRQQTVDLGAANLVDSALFRNISLYDISGAGILLPADQREMPSPSLESKRRH